MNLLMRRVTAVSSAMALSAGVLVLGGWRSGMLWPTTPANIAASTLPSVPANLPVLNNDHSAGYVTFTFDDGPDTYTMQMLATLKAEHVPAVFFVIGQKVAANPAIVKAEAANGYAIGDHTWDHKSLTGASTNTKPLTLAQVRAELTRTIGAITATGLPAPTLWRAPYDDVTQQQANLGTSLGLRLVMSYGLPGTGNIVDSQDWTGISPQKIAEYITQGYVVNQTNGKISSATSAQRASGLAHHGATAGPNIVYFHGAQAGSIVSFHDGLVCAPNVMAAIPIIVRWLNAHHLGATATVRPNATGGVLTQKGSSGGGSG